MTESSICDVIDELWTKYDAEPWLARLVDTGDAGKKLREIAVSILKKDGRHHMIVDQLRMMADGRRILSDLNYKAAGR